MMSSLRFAVSIGLCLVLSVAFQMVLSYRPAPRPGPGPANGPQSSGNEPAVYYGVQDGCELIECSNGSSCGIRNLTVKYGNMPFQNYLYPKCVAAGAPIDENTDNDGNAHNEIDGPGCNLVQCSGGYVCQVRISTVKIGNMPYMQSIGGFPKCVLPNSNSSDADSSSTVTVGGPGCDLVGNCSAGQQCMVATGIGKAGFLPYAQFFWPFCG